MSHQIRHKLNNLHVRDCLTKLALPMIVLLFIISHLTVFMIDLYIRQSIKACESMAVCIRQSVMFYVAKQIESIENILFSFLSPFLHKGSLQKKKPEIYWSFTNTGYPPLPPLARIGNFRFFLRLFSRGGWS